MTAPSQRYSIGSSARWAMCDLSDLPWYVAFQYWRLSCISEGVRFRYAAGVMGDADGNVDLYATSIDFMLERCKAILDAGSLS